MMYHNIVGQGRFFRYLCCVSSAAFNGLQYFGSGSKAATYVSYAFQVSVRMEIFFYGKFPDNRQASWIEKL